MKRVKNILTILVVALLAVGCSGYNKVLKSTDNDLKFSKAKEYYDKGKYLNAATLFESVLTPFRGTEKGEEALYLTAMSYFKNKDNLTARSYFTAYGRSYPRGKYAEECKFQVGYCYYLESPDAKLDQEFTNKAIDEFISFTELYPNSKKLPEATLLLKELQEKLAYKAFLNVKLYYKLGNYQGNNYQAAVVAARNAIKSFSGSKYEEEFAIYILRSKYEEAIASVESKMADRLQDTIDEYYSFINDYPNSKYKKEATSIFEKVSKKLKKSDNNTNDNNA